MEYKLVYRHNFKMLLELNRLYRKVHLKWLYVAVSVIMCICGAAMIASAVVRIHWLGWQVILFIFLGIFFVAAGIFMDCLNALISKSLMMNGVGDIEITVGEDGVTAKSLKSEERYYFSAAAALYQSRGIYYMFIDKRYSVMFPENAFTEGDPAGFGEYLAEKCGMPVKTVK